MDLAPETVAAATAATGPSDPVGHSNSTNAPPKTIPLDKIKTPTSRAGQSKSLHSHRDLHSSSNRRFSVSTDPPAPLLSHRTKQAKRHASVRSDRLSRGKSDSDLKIPTEGAVGDTKPSGNISVSPSSDLNRHKPKKNGRRSSANKKKEPRDNSKATDKEKLETKTEQKKHVNHSDWFQELTGCTEQVFATSREKSIFENKDISPEQVKKFGPLLTLKHQTDESVVTICGQFKMHMYGDLLLALGFGKHELKKQVEKGTSPCEFEIVTRLDDESLRFVDVAHLQTLKENCDAVFQIASNFNAVEAINELSAPDKERFTEMYHIDRTQGPAASISAGGGAITRVHAAFYSQNKPPTKWGQDANRQLNFAQDKKLTKHFPITNGYVIYTGSEPKKFPKETNKKYKKLMASYLIAYHRGQQVTYGHRTNDQFEVCTDKDQRVDQVCCAAVNMLQGRTGLTNKDLDPKRSKMSFILQAVYNSAYMTAIYNGREKLFLTLVGGGAFGNELPNILGAIQNAHIEWSKHSQSKLKKVVLVLFGPRKEVPSFIQSLVNAGVKVSYIIYTRSVGEAQPIPEKETSHSKK